MISALSAWVKAIAAAGVLVAFVEMMAPKGALRKSVDMVLALVIVAAIAGPIIELGAILLPMGGLGFEVPAVAAATTPVGTDEAVANGVALCLKAGLAAAFPEVSGGWVITVTPARRGSAADVTVTVDTRGWADEETEQAQVHAAAAACAGISIDRIRVR